jgi:Ran GTPase-activating protein (RanGAP) involved in mRNA processing and transport
MITILNLRRNKISNEGAKALADLIKNFDNSITHLDVTRNRIGADGGQQLLDALSTTTRIVEFEIKYGNPISSKMGRIFEREIKANL